MRARQGSCAPGLLPAQPYRPTGERKPLKGSDVASYSFHLECAAGRGFVFVGVFDEKAARAGLGGAGELKREMDNAQPERLLADDADVVRCRPGKRVGQRRVETAQRKSADVRGRVTRGRPA